MGGLGEPPFTVKVTVLIELSRLRVPLAPHVEPDLAKLDATLKALADVRFETVADGPWPAEPELSATNQFVAVLAPPPTKAMPTTADIDLANKDFGARWVARGFEAETLAKVVECAPLAQSVR